jgi:hypothetical protein
MTDREKAKILETVPSTDSIEFSEFCNDYPDTPAKGDKQAWSALFRQLDDLKREGLLRIEREDGRISEMELTEAGAQWVRDFRKVHFSK